MINFLDLITTFSVAEIIEVTRYHNKLITKIYFVFLFMIFYERFRLNSTK